MMRVKSLPIRTNSWKKNNDFETIPNVSFFFLLVGHIVFFSNFHMQNEEIQNF